jgi:hypothetical protein
MRVVQFAVGLAIVLGAAPSFAQQRQENGAEGTQSKKAEACRAKARQAGHALMRGSGTSNIVEAQEGQARMRAFFLRCMARS